MELWIRSQDKRVLTKSCDLVIEEYSPNFVDVRTYTHEGFSFKLGEYKTKERALEILDEIQSKINQQFICKIHSMVHPLDAKRIKEELSKEYKGDFILETPQMDIEPINSQILIYEMPEE